MSNQMVLDGTLEPQKVMAAFVDLMNQAFNDPQTKAQTVGAPVGPYVHGPGGLFGVRGLEQDIISTHTTPMGLAGVLPFMPTNDVTPLAPYITGFIRSDQQEKDGVCDDPPPAGNMKTCILTTQFARKEFMTRQLEVNKVGERINRGEFNDLRVINSPLVGQMGGLVNAVYPLRNQSVALNIGREMVARLIEVAVAYQRWFCPQVYTGNPQNNAAGGGYKEFIGLDLLISTTKVDAISNNACTALYSLVRSFNYQQANSPTLTPTIVEVLTNMFRYLNMKARRQDLAPVEWVMTMRPELFDVLADMWPCVYNSYRCFTVATAGIDPVPDLNSAAMRRMSEEMREGSYLIIDGRRIPVIQDDCITEETQADVGAIPIGGFASDIYIVPVTARGGTIRTTYFEHYDYRNGPLNVVTDVGRGNRWWWSDSGVFLWGEKAPDNWCYELISKVEPRLRLRTPQLAARLTDVVYVPLIHYDDSLPSSEYWLDGGNPTGYPFPSPYTEVNPDGPGPGA